MLRMQTATKDSNAVNFPRRALPEGSGVVRDPVSPLPQNSEH